MSGLEAGIYVLLITLVFLGAGVWIFMGLILVGVFSLYYFAGFPMVRIGGILESTIWKSAASWELAAVPMFVWLGEIVYRTDISDRIFRGLEPWLSRIPGRLLHTNILGSTLFAAVCGSSGATTATVGKVTSTALRERGYAQHLAIGSLAGAGTIGLMMPPSIFFIIYGILAEVSIAKLFVAGIVPGLLIAGLFSAYMIVACLYNPSYAPDRGRIFNLRDRLRGLYDLLPMLTMIAVVLGSIYLGIATPSEAGAIGVVMALAIVVLTGQFSFTLMRESLMSAIMLTAMITSIIIAANFLSVCVAFLHIPLEISMSIAALDLSPYVLILILTLFFILLGTVLDGGGILVMTLPLTLPLVVHAGFDPIWYGVMMCVTVELANISPPIGVNLFVLRAITGKSVAYISTAALPFFTLLVLTIVMLAIWPDIALWLPSLM